MTASRTADLERLTLGFIPLLDAALPIIAREGGFFAAEGLDVALSRENAWSTLRDKLAAGLLDGAHMLAPLPLAMSLGISGAACETLAPLVLGRNGNTLVLSKRWSEGMPLPDAPAPEGSATAPAVSARDFARRLRHRGGPPPCLAMVHPFSCQHYQLREWLALGGIDADHEVKLVVLPPPRMAEALEEGRIDGFCVGEPWGSLAQHRGGGRIVASGAQLWPDHPEKVLGVTATWAERHPETLAALLRALAGAADWLAASPEHARQARDWLALPPYLDRAVSHLETLAPGTEPIRQRLDGDLRPSAEAMAPMANHIDQALRAQGGRLAPERLSACYSPVHFDATTHQDRA
ncbi:CmpA/NrtA family ABC transporter substrate-binding protein [Halomonas nitroreducens]|uniref:Nitrate transporter NrtA n=1 Tax=Halomonas nitroreducens TaxID=447425 RepID=A0A3S0K2S2_9GAMM|nr:CmpA/NrtA family ABC transporter substrate-binding protein [Halomonas nitroreducens]RTR02910.1 nitrate transporter NrtA [Halomonas nitroreducens]